jgi:DNA-binding transcriptional MocR family regulator
MSKKKIGNRREKSHGRFVSLQEWMQASPAWKSLDGNCRAGYVELARRYRGPNSNNGKILYSVRELAAALHVSQDTAKRIFNTLQDRGFIKNAKGSGFNVKGRICREWLLTEFPDDTSGRTNEATKDFMRWTPSQNSFHSTTTGAERTTTGAVLHLRSYASSKKSRLCTSGRTQKAQKARSSVR